MAMAQPHSMEEGRNGKKLNPIDTEETQTRTIGIRGNQGVQEYWAKTWGRAKGSKD